MNLPTTRGTNPTDTVLQMDDNDSKDQTDKSVSAIINLGQNKDRALIVSGTGQFAQVSAARRTLDGKWVGIKIADKTKEGLIGNPSRDLREAGGNTYAAGEAGMEKIEVFKETKEIENRGLPFGVDVPNQNEDGVNKLDMNKYLQDVEKGIANYLTQQGIREGKARDMASIMAPKIVFQDFDYSKALQYAEQNIDKALDEKEDGAKTLADGNPRSRK